MKILDSIKEAFFTKIGEINFSGGEFLLRILIAFLLIILGIIIGKLVKFALRKFLDKINIKKIAKLSFVNLFLVVVKWSVYILFINIALIQLGIPEFTGWLTTILGVIPSLTGSLVIISTGFAIADFLKKVISESKVDEWQTLSQIFFYFILYVFIIFALKTSLLTLRDNFISNILVVVFTILAGIGFLISYFRAKK